MKGSTVILFGLVGVLLAGVFTSSGAAAKKGGRKGKKAEKIEKPQAPEYMVVLAKGHDAFIIKDYEKALRLYKEAAEKSPKSPMPHYFMGCAHRALKKYDEAVDSFKTAFLMASDDDWWKGISAFNVAVTCEEAGKLQEAKSAWEDFKRFAVGSDQIKKHLKTAESRIEAISRYIALNEKYEIVRQRIARGESH